MRGVFSTYSTCTIFDGNLNFSPTLNNLSSFVFTYITQIQTLNGFRLAIIMPQSKAGRKKESKRLILKDEQTRDLLKSYNTIEFDRFQVEILKKDLAELARYAYPGREIDVYLCGSRVTGLAQWDSDVDLYLDIGKTFGGSISEDVHEQRDRLVKINNVMLHDDKFNVTKLLTTARVPILKFKHLSTALNCDLSFRSGMSTKNSELIKFYLDWDPRVKYVVTAVKIFMKENGLAGSTLYNTYAQIWLTLFFLMQPGIELIPTLLGLRIQAKQSGTKVTQTIVEDWDVTVPVVDEEWRKNWLKKKCKLSEEELLEKFYIFYSNLPPLEDEYVLSTYNGTITKKIKVFSKARKPIRQYYEKYRAEKDKKEYRDMLQKFKDDINNRFYLQDPFHQLKNLTKLPDADKSKVQMLKFVGHCEEMVEKLSPPK